MIPQTCTHLGNICDSHFPAGSFYNTPCRSHTEPPPATCPPEFRSCSWGLALYFMEVLFHDIAKGHFNILTWTSSNGGMIECIKCLLSHLIQVFAIKMFPDINPICPFLRCTGVFFSGSSSELSGDKKFSCGVGWDYHWVIYSCRYTHTQI